MSIRRALVSIHDLMPATRGRVTEMLALLHHQLPGLTPASVMLLVVPGQAWRREDLDWLAGLAGRGYELAGHGWTHQAVAERDWYHRVHSRLMSSHVAEHLSRREDELAALVRACSDWFPRHHLPAPSLYVPPAWALGSVPPDAWAETSFSMVETLGGIRCLQTGAFRSLPLAGYEADSLPRAWGLKLFNQLSFLRATMDGAPVRLALHPYDLSLLLKRNLVRDLGNVARFERYGGLVIAASGQPSELPSLRSRSR